MMINMPNIIVYKTIKSTTHKGKKTTSYDGRRQLTFHNTQQ